MGSKKWGGCHSSFSLNMKAQGGLSLLAIETSKLQDDDCDITNNDDNSTNQAGSDRHFSVLGHGEGTSFGVLASELEKSWILANCTSVLGVHMGLLVLYPSITTPPCSQSSLS